PLACTSCHVPTDPKGRKAPAWKIEKNFTDCKGCHIQGEPESHRHHLFEKPPCDSCHRETRKWSDFSFDHARKTKFPLSGKHAELDCVSCHRPRIVAKPDKACESCHAKADPHKDRFAKAFPSCGTCHNTVDW